jgi:protein KRI1
MDFKGILDKDIPEALQVNSKFARSFEAKKRREEIQKAKERAQELHLYSGSEVSSSESEDSSAELLTSKANSKFLKLMTMIKTSDPALKDPDYKAFSDSDFETSSEKSLKQGKEGKQVKPVRYKDQLRQSLLNPTTDKPNTEVQKQRELKDDFLSAVSQWENLDKDQDLLKPRKQDSKKDSEDDLIEAVQEITKDKKELKKLKEFWGTSESHDDQFLKNFVLKKMWQEPDEKLLTYDEIVEEEDEKKTNEAEKFETAYNFRFEEEGFDKLKCNL